MKFLKWFGLTIIGILLFISLSVFGIAFTLKSTVVNSSFITNEIEKVPVSALVTDSLNSESDVSVQNFNVNLSPEIKTAIEQTVSETEPELKQQTGQAVNLIYDYLQGKKPSPEVAATLRSTILSDEFIDSVIDNFPLSNVIASRITDQLNTQNIPLAALLLENQINTALSETEPQLKAELKIAAPQVIDYLLGNTSNLNATIDLGPVIDNLKSYARNLLLNPPPVLAAALGSSLQEAAANPDSYIETFFGPVLDNIDQTITIDNSTFGSDAQANIVDGINKTEDALRQARPYVTDFNTYYILLILFMLVLVGGIIAIHRSVRGAARSIGSIFLSYGIIVFAGLLIARYIFQSYGIPRIQSQQFINGSPMPPELVSFIRQVFLDVTSPLFYFSMGVLIAGVVLFIISFVYRSRRKDTTAN